MLFLVKGKQLRYSQLLELCVWLLSFTRSFLLNSRSIDEHCHNVQLFRYKKIVVPFSDKNLLYYFTPTDPLFILMVYHARQPANKCFKCDKNGRPAAVPAN